MSTPPSCSECGARLSEDAAACDLCGHPVGANPTPGDADAPPREAPPSGPASASPAAGAAAEGAVFCNACGWQNPAGANFCSRCGQPLQQVQRSGAVSAPRRPQAPPSASPAAPPVPPNVPPRAGRQVGLIVGAGVLLVVALFLVSVVSQENRPATAAQGGGAAAGAATVVSEPTPAPPPAAIAGRAAELEDEITHLEGTELQASQLELVELYAGAGRYDLAAPIQQQLAEAVDTEGAWTRTGNFYYDAMEQEEGGARAYYAKRAVAAYQNALELNPDNLDVRTDMAVAYMYDPDNPMEAIRQTNLVLDADSNHVQANFNRGIMLMQINRLDQATEQFLKVQRIVGNPQSPVHQRAQEVIDAIGDIQGRNG